MPHAFHFPAIRSKGTFPANGGVRSQLEKLSKGTFEGVLRGGLRVVLSEPEEKQTKILKNSEDILKLLG